MLWYLIFPVLRLPVGHERRLAVTTEVLRLDGELLVAVGSGTTRLATGQDLEILLYLVRKKISSHHSQFN